MLRVFLNCWRYLEFGSPHIYQVYIHIHVHVCIHIYIHICVSLCAENYSLRKSDLRVCSMQGRHGSDSFCQVALCEKGWQEFKQEGARHSSDDPQKGPITSSTVAHGMAPSLKITYLHTLYIYTYTKHECKYVYTWMYKYIYIYTRTSLCVYAFIAYKICVRTCICI